VIDAGLLWTAVGSIAAIPALAVGAWQLRLQVLERREKQFHIAEAATSTPSELGVLPVVAPLGRLPADVRGRDALLAELCRPLSRRGGRGDVWVVAGMGGLGKSTVALAVAEAARARGWRVWWITATDTASLTGGMLEVLRQLGAPEGVTRLVREGAPIAPDRAWEVLNGKRLTGQRWLLVLDNADNPTVLAAAGNVSPADGTGWLRRGTAGMVLVTTRNKDSRVWGHIAQMRELGPLDDATAAQVLHDLAPDIHDPEGRSAKELGRRLGGLPLALHLAGTYIASPYARWHSFAAYLDALDGDAFPGALAELDEPSAQARATVARTWELSLDAIVADGYPQARSLLFLISCYAANAGVPIEMLRPELLGEILPPDGQDRVGTVVDLESRGRRLRDRGLRSLSAVGLINTASGTGGAKDQVVTVHPIVADVNRSELLTTAQTDLPVIGAIAVRLLRVACQQLDVWRPADWPTWRRLVPHVSSLLGWLAPHMNTDILAELVTAGALAAEALWRSGNSTTSERLARSCVAAAGRLGSDNIAAMTARSCLAHVVADSNYSEAEQLFRELLSDQLRVLGKDHQQTFVSRRLLARLTGLQGQYLKAEPLYRQLLEDDRRILGEEHPETLITRHGLARATARLGRYSEAESLFLQLLPDLQRLHGMDHLECIEARRGIARVVADMGRLAEAEHLYKQLLADDRRILGDQHPHTLAVRRELTRVVADRGRRGEAKRQYRRLLADCCQILGEKHPITLTTRESLTGTGRIQARTSKAPSSYSDATDP